VILAMGLGLAHGGQEKTKKKPRKNLNKKNIKW